MSWGDGIMPKINITLPEGFLKEVDKSAAKERLNRSEFFRRAVQTYWEVQRQKASEKKRAKRIEKAMEMQEMIREKAGEWDAVGEIRKWREKR